MIHGTPPAAPEVFLALADQAPVGVICFAANGDALWFNDQLLTIIEGQAENVLRFNCLRDSEPEVVAHLKLAFAGQRVRYQRRHASVAGERTGDLDVHLIPLSTDGQVLSLIVDRTEVVSAEQRLAWATPLFESGTPVYLTDADRVIVEVNPALCSLTGHAPSALVGQHERIVRAPRLSPQTLADRARGLDGVGEWRGELWLAQADGGAVPVLQSATRVAFADQTVGFVFVCQDLSQLKAAEALGHKLRRHDRLTELLNRQGLDEALQRALAASSLDGDRAALAVFDLDHFTRINDGLGHLSGDAVLTLVAERLQGLLRDGDRAARTGGDEFACLFTELGEHRDLAARRALGLARQVRRRIAQPMRVDGREIEIKVSGGLTLLAPHEAPSAAMRAAGAALHRAKDQGRDQLAFFEPQMQAEIDARVKLERALRQALRGNELRLAVQPQLAKGGALQGVEVLVRWQRPEHGLVMPGAFLPVAEEAGLMPTLGRWVLHEALDLWLTWRQRGHVVPELAVNVSPSQFRDITFVNEVRDALLHRGLAGVGCPLVLELTEQTLLEDTDRALAAMDSLAPLGVRFSIDDFGTGYSSLTHLHRLPVAQVKVDRSFVADAGQGATGEVITAAVIAMGRALEVDVVAEGVETATQLDWLVRRGCHLLQGFLLGRPSLADAAGPPTPFWPKRGQRSG